MDKILALDTCDGANADISSDSSCQVEDGYASYLLPSCYPVN